MSKKGKTMSEIMEEVKRKGQRFRFKCPHCAKDIDIVVIASGTAIAIDR